MPASKSGVWANPRHGTTTGYANYGCRCDACRAANARRHHAYVAKNGERVRAYQRELHKSRPDLRRKNDLRRYGLTEQHYGELLERQDGRCAVCRVKPTGSPLQVDHDHNCCAEQRSCGRCVRGLLCAACNSAIAFLADDPKRLERAMNYLTTKREYLPGPVPQRLVAD